jgi:hypothetical protein
MLEENSIHASVGAVATKKAAAMRIAAHVEVRSFTRGGV